MADLNACNFTGRLGRDPEVKTFPSGDSVANFSIAVSRKWKDKTSGEMREKTLWLRCVVNGALVKVVQDYVKKGSQICVNGELEERKWTGQDGVEKFSTELRVGFLQLLGGKPGGAAPAAAPAPAARPPAAGPGNMDEDIPF